MSQFVPYFLALLLLIIIWSILTNPDYSRTIVRPHYRAKFKNGKIVAKDELDELQVLHAFYWRWFGFIKSVVFMIDSRYFHSPRSKSDTVRGIAADIRALRFDPTNLYVISGDHFNPLYIRSLGIFYYPLLDASIKTTQNDWHNREITSLQTTAYALGVYEHTKDLSTTIVQTGRNSVVPINVYSYPSDSMYSILYALAVMTGVEKARPYDYDIEHYALDTTEEASRLLAEHNASLTRHFNEYRTTIYDTTTGLIRKDIHLSGTKDITRRTCAFYDNVVLWRTIELAQKLGLTERDTTFLKEYKTRITETFWLEKQGYFLEDLSDEGVANSYYSSDWLIMLSTRFLDPSKPKERVYYERCIAYIATTGIAQPFGLKYQDDTRAHRQFLPVRLAVASYGGDTIWSFWGLEYMKALLALYRETGDKTYLQEADRNIDAYKDAMLTYGGFPEVYHPNGRMLKSPAYRSVRQTGWVIGFEQAVAMRRAIVKD